jgi:hypothetical protein
LTIEDYYKIKSVGDPQISPNGMGGLHAETRVEEDNTSTIERSWCLQKDRPHLDGSRTRARA